MKESVVDSKSLVENGFSLIELMMGVGALGLFLYAFNSIGLQSSKMQRTNNEKSTFMQLSFEIERMLEDNDFDNGCSGALVGQKITNELSLNFNAKGMLSQPIIAGLKQEQYTISAVNLELDAVGPKPYFRTAELIVKADSNNQMISFNRNLEAKFHIVLFLDKGDNETIEKCSLANSDAASCLGIVTNSDDCKLGFVPANLTLLSEYIDGFFCTKYGFEPAWCNHQTSSAKAIYSWYQTYTGN